MRVGIAADHGGFVLKQQIAEALRAAGHHIVDFGAYEQNPEDDYPDFVVPLAWAVSRGEVERGIAICGSGVGACVAADKVPGVRGALIHDIYSAHQGVEHDDMNLLCIGAWVTGYALAWDLIQAFLAAHFSGSERHARRLEKVAALERRMEEAKTMKTNRETGQREERASTEKKEGS